MTTKKGILKYIANSGAKGCKFEDDSNTWYNPVNEVAKQQIKDDYKGELVEITLVEGKKTMFSSMILCEEKEEEQPVVTEEQMGEEPEEEKVPHTPPKEEEETQTGVLMDVRNLTYSRDVFMEMEQTKLETAKKGPMKLTYVSWAEAWGALKRLHPTAQFKVYEHEKTGMPFIYDKEFGAFVKVSVTVLGLTHKVHLPVMNHSNKAAHGTELDVFLINKNIQRALAKAISLHGLGLYVFKGEDYPDEK